MRQLPYEWNEAAALRFFSETCGLAVARGGVRLNREKADGRRFEGAFAGHCSVELITVAEARDALRKDNLIETGVRRHGTPACARISPYGGWEQRVPGSGGGATAAGSRVGGRGAAGGGRGGGRGGARSGGGPNGADGRLAREMELTRLRAVKEAFTTFAERIMSLLCRSGLGLISFSSGVNVECALTDVLGASSWSSSQRTIASSV